MLGMASSSDGDNEARLIDRPTGHDDDVSSGLATVLPITNIAFTDQKPPLTQRPTVTTVATSHAYVGRTDPNSVGSVGKNVGSAAAHVTADRPLLPANSACVPADTESALGTCP